MLLLLQQCNAFSMQDSPLTSLKLCLHDFMLCMYMLLNSMDFSLEVQLQVLQGLHGRAEKQPKSFA